MKTLTQYIVEKLIINKNFKSFTFNNEIYDRFKKTFQKMSTNNMWSVCDDLNDIGSLSSNMRKHLNDVIRPLIPKNESIFVHLVDNKFGISTFERIINEINKNHDKMDFLYDDCAYEYETSTKKYKLIAKVFETDECVIGVVGPEDTSYSSPSNNVIIFAYK